jgi:ABC-type transporter Mla MlaB component
MKITVTERGQVSLADLLDTTPADEIGQTKSFRIHHSQSTGSLKQLVEKHKSVNMTRNKALIISLGNTEKLMPQPRVDMDTINAVAKHSVNLSQRGRSPSEQPSPFLISRHHTKKTSHEGYGSSNAMRLREPFSMTMIEESSILKVNTSKSPIKPSDMKADPNLFQLSANTPNSIRMQAPDSPWKKGSLKNISKTALTISKFKDFVQTLDTDKSLRSSAWAKRNLSTISDTGVFEFELVKKIDVLKSQPGMSDYFKVKIDNLTRKLSELNILMDSNSSMADVLKFIIKDQHVFSELEKISILKKYSPLQVVNFSDYNLEDVIENKEQLRKLLTNKLQKIDTEINRIKLSFNRSKISFKLQGNLTSRIHLQVKIRREKLQGDAGSDMIAAKGVKKIDTAIKTMLHDFNKTVSSHALAKKKAWDEKRFQFDKKNIEETERKSRNKEINGSQVKSSKVLNWGKLLDSQTKLY